MATNFTLDVDRVVRNLQATGNRARRALSIALLKTANLIKAAEQAEMSRVFVCPTPYTLRSLWTKSKYSAQTIQVSVEIKNKFATAKGNAAADYLRPQIEGGSRPFKRFERLLHDANVLPPGMYAVPGPGMRLDAYGNMSSGHLIQILSALHALHDPAQWRRVGPRTRTGRAGPRSLLRRPARAHAARTRVRAARATYFVSQGGRLRQGVWQRTSQGLSCVLVFRSSLHYQRRYDFYGVGERVFQATFRGQWQAALRQVGLYGP
jgi:hypothetical protein